MRMVQYSYTKLMKIYQALASHDRNKLPSQDCLCGRNQVRLGTSRPIRWVAQAFTFGCEGARVLYDVFPATLALLGQRLPQHRLQL